MITSNKLKIFYLILIFLNIFIYFLFNNFNFNLGISLVNFGFPIINFVSILSILLIIIYKIRVHKNEDKNYIIHSFLFVFFLTINLIINGNINIEFYAYNLTSSIEYIKNIFNFRIIQWSDSRSLGIPMPIIPSFHFNPFLYLGYFLNLKVFYISLFFTHSFLGVFYMIKLSDMFIKNSYLHILNGFLFSFSAPLLNYMVTDDWNASFISYSLLPLLVYIILQLFIKERKIDFFSLSIISLFIFYYYYNGNPSFHIFIGFISLVVIFLCFIFKLKFKNFYNIIIVSSISFVLILPNLIHVVIELSKFKYDYQNLNTNIFFAVHWFRLIDNMFPFVSFDGSNINFDFFKNISNQYYVKSINILFSNFLNHGTRTYFIGFIYFILSFFSLFYLLNRNKNLILLKIFFIIFILCLILMHFKSFYFYNLIDENYYGVLFIFIGLILATYSIDKLNIKYKNIVSLLIFLQSFQVLTYSSLSVFILKNGQNNKIFSTNFFNENTDNNLYDWIDNIGINEDKKVIFSPLIEKDLNKEYAVYNEYNLFSIQDFYYKKNIRLMNDSFLKGISYDNILISKSEKNGNFELNNQIFSNKNNLDILGADFIIIKEKEIKNYSFIESLDYISSIELNKIESLKLIVDDGKVANSSSLINRYNKFFYSRKYIVAEKWYAFANNNSYGDLFAINYPYYEKNKYLIYNSKCIEISFFCQNNSNLHINKINFSYSLKGKDGNYSVSFDKTKDKIIIVFNKIYRNEWKAKYLNKSLKVFPIHDSLVGIEIPPGVNKIKIYYENIFTKFLTYISIIMLLLLIISLPFSYYSMSKRLYKSD